MVLTIIINMKTNNSYKRLIQLASIRQKSVKNKVEEQVKESISLLDNIEINEINCNDKHITELNI